MSDINWDLMDAGDIIDQIHKDCTNYTYKFNLMLVGLSGVGKSSLVRSLYRGKIEPREVDGVPKLNEYTALIEEHGVKLKLRCVETSNFRTHDPELYAEYIEDKYRKYFIAEQRQSESDIEDCLIHCCLYLIPPHGKMRLQDEDIECMKALHERVNLIPIIPKSEFYEASQKAKFKENILTDLKRHGIKYYKFGFDEREDEDRSFVVKQYAERFPFAVVAADEPVMENGVSRWIRKTDSCIIDIFDKKYDFDAFSKLLVRHCKRYLIDSTYEELYASYKSHLLREVAKHGSGALEGIGLEADEMGRIAFEMDWLKREDRPSIEQLRLAQEQELADLKHKLKLLKTRGSRSQQTPSKSKPQILHENPFARDSGSIRRK